jgi:hypothetical protein
MRWVGALVVFGACAGAPPRVDLSGRWPEVCSNDYYPTTLDWTRTAEIRSEYQQILDLRAVLKSPDWRCAHAVRDISERHLDGPARDAAWAQARADAAGPLEVELIAAMWDRKENDLDRGQRSVWRVVLVDESGREIAPLEILKDKRSMGVLRAEFGKVDDFAVAYIARFPVAPSTPLGPNVRKLRLRMSSERGSVELLWQAP